MKKILEGMGVSKGKVKGRARIIKDFDDHKNFNEGDILITRLTSPDMVPIMNKAAGIICDMGGLTSHPSIVSREMGIPCIVNAKRATELIKEGNLIQMCGESGEIYKI